jgi:general secretion pathway protein L
MEGFDIGPAIVLIPSESVLLTTVDLPLASRRARLDALPFAIEDRIAESFASVHIALGNEVSPGRYLAAIVDPALMQRWTAVLDEAGLDRARLVPDALALPMPAPGAWSVDLAGGRAMVRTDDGAGFALPAANLDAAWRAAGQPAVHAYGEPLAFAETVTELEVAPLAARLTAPALDLRQGPYAPPRQAASPLLRRIAIVAAIGLLAHGAIAAADTLALGHLAQQRAAETRALAEQIAPGTAIGDDVASSVADMLPANGSGPSEFLPLVSRVTAALAPLGQSATLVDLSFDGGAGTVAIDVDAPDSAGLQRVSETLQKAGLDAQSGASQIAPGKASGAFLVRSAR